MTIHLKRIHLVKFIGYFIIHEFHHSQIYAHTTVYEQCILAEDVAQKEVVIIYADAIIYPWTVMVKTLYTLVTYSTVSAPNCPQNLALRA